MAKSQQLAWSFSCSGLTLELCRQLSHNSCLLSTDLPVIGFCVSNQNAQCAARFHQWLFTAGCSRQPLMNLISGSNETFVQTNICKNWSNTKQISPLPVCACWTESHESSLFLCPCGRCSPTSPCSSGLPGCRSSMCSSRGPCPPAGGTTHNVSCRFRKRWQSWLKWGNISRLAISKHYEHLSVCKINGGHWLFSFLFVYWTTCFSTVLSSEAPKFSQYLWMTKETPWGNRQSPADRSLHHIPEAFPWGLWAPPVCFHYLL